MVLPEISQQPLMASWNSKVHTHVALNEDGCPCVIQTQGNCDAHVVLRGGDSGSNYDALSIAETMARLEHHKLPLRIVIDCSHQNSGKHYDYQSIVFQSVIDQYIQDTRVIRGLMLESHLNAGRQNLMQDPSKLDYGVSITDACLDWDSTARLIRWGAERLHEQKYVPQTDKKIVNGSDLHVHHILKILFLALLVSLTSCSTHRLTVQTQYLARENLASYFMGLPDPHLDNPVIGQRLLIEWCLPVDLLKGKEVELSMKIRLKNLEERTIHYSIPPKGGSFNRGYYLLYLVGNDYCETGGISTYNVEILSDGIFVRILEASFMG